MGTFWLSSLRRGSRAFGSCPNLSALADADAAAAAAAAAASAEPGLLSESRGASRRPPVPDCPAPSGPAVDGGNLGAGGVVAARCASSPAGDSARRSSESGDAPAEVRAPGRPRPHWWLNAQSQIFRL
jgi:hypothetical protein